MDKYPLATWRWLGYMNDIIRFNEAHRSRLQGIQAEANKIVE